MEDGRPRGNHDARSHRVHCDAVGRDFDRQAPAKTEQTRFRRAVGEARLHNCVAARL